MFRDDPIQCPNKNPVLGRYLGTAIDVGDSQDHGNGEVMHRSTYGGLKEDQWTNQAHMSLRKDFDSNIKDRIGPDASYDDFTDINLEDTPLYAMYEDDTIDVEVGLAGNTEYDEGPAMAIGLYREVPTPEGNSNYLNALVMLPRGNSYARVKVIGRKRDADGNAVGRYNDNPILDTREYSVEFDDGEISELTANLISESIYAACDDSGNDYLIIDSISDY